MRTIKQRIEQIARHVSTGFISPETAREIMQSDGLDVTFQPLPGGLTYWSINAFGLTTHTHKLRS